MLERYSLLNRLALGAFVAFWSLGQLGCQRQAYTDFYTESMAGEIRELENRIYEYDAAYQSIEQELAFLESENAELHSRLMQIESAPPAKKSSGAFFGGSTSAEAIPARPEKTEAPPPIRLSPTEVPSVDNLPKPKASKPSEPTPAPKKESSPSFTPGASKPKSDTGDLAPPMIEMGVPSSGQGIVLPPNGDALPKPTSPSIPTTPPATKVPATPSPFLPPPTSGTSLPKTSGEDSAQIAAALPTDTLDSIDAKIAIPEGVVAAGFQKPKSRPKGSNVDRKIVEIGFHPSLCRGQNLDEEEGDDGLYLVLQPRNQAGEVVDQPAAVTIVAMDPERPEAESRIARWTVTKEELDAALEPIGSSHGYHVSLPWQSELKPEGDSVQVYVRYEMEDGRRLINERTIRLHRVAAGNNVWMPR